MALLDSYWVFFLLNTTICKPSLNQKFKKSEIKHSVIVLPVKKFCLIAYGLIGDMCVSQNKYIHACSTQRLASVDISHSQLMLNLPRMCECLVGVIRVKPATT